MPAENDERDLLDKRLNPRCGTPSREAVSARSMVAGLMCATRSIISREM